jgi:hypothetical protein
VGLFICLIQHPLKLLTWDKDQKTKRSFHALEWAASVMWKDPSNVSASHWRVSSA